MKWIKNPLKKVAADTVVELQIGDTREREGFLWLPKTIGRETRWLEWAVWKQVYASFHHLVPERGMMEVVGWLDAKWMGPYSSIQAFINDYPWDQPTRK